MNVLIDNKDLESYFNIKVLDYTAALGIAPERVNQITWADKSGVDTNLVNRKYDEREFVLECLVKASNEGAAYDLVKVLTDYLFSKGGFVLSLRDATRNIRKAFLCVRSGVVIGNIKVRTLNSLYHFKLGLRDVNPNALKYQVTVSGNSGQINYDKGQRAVLYWGDGDIEEVSNSGIYVKTDFPSDGEYDVIVDIDQDAEAVTSLAADFEADVLSGALPLEVNFTDLSTGDIVIWSWDFGDGNTSSEQNPTHTYETAGVFTVTLQIFNSAQGSDVETKTNYISTRGSRGLINDIGDAGSINGVDYGLIN